MHALERLAQRKINRKLVEDCLEAPDKIIPENGKFKCVKMVNDNVLIVIYIVWVKLAG